MKTMVLLAALITAASSAWAAGPKRPRAAFSGDGNRIAFLASGYKLRVLDGNGKVISETPVGSTPTEIVFSSDGVKVAVCTTMSGLFVITEGQSAPAQLEYAGECSDLHWSPDGQKLFYVLTLSGTLSKSQGSNSRELKVWNAANGALKTVLASPVEGDLESAPIPGLVHRARKQPSAEPAPTGLMPHPDARGRQ